MNTALSFERFILTKELNERIKKVGDVFEIAYVTEDAFMLRDGKTRVAIGLVNFDDFNSHFVREENFNGWTNWTPLTGFDGQTDALYKTNRKKVIVKFLTDKVRAEACCNKADDFNLFFGVQVAYLRCLNKALEKRKAEYENALKAINVDIANNTNVIEKMIDSLI